MSVREFTRGLLLVAMLSLIFARTSAAGGEPQSISAQTSSGGAGASGQMKIKVNVAGKELQATLADNPTARDFAALLPIRVSMDDLFGREKAGSPPRAISTGGPSSDVYQVGDIGYWSPGHDIAIYYRQDGEKIPSPGIIKIGHFDSGVAALNVPGSVEVSIKRVE
ncbi:cyclophilin-like fold protein [Paraburkholderia youngii]|uniref:cyclophilin-like fold protein n=1 Tax=Paraburkholderia youngii TaxID=2782701 RepID=UPI003D222D2B